MKNLLTTVIVLTSISLIVAMTLTGFVELSTEIVTLSGMGMLFFNVSNHPFERWSEKQLNAALELGGKVTNVPFPNVDPMNTPLQVKELANTILNGIIDVMEDRDCYEATVLIAGEQSLVYRLVKIIEQNNEMESLSKYKINCVCACSERNTVELADGSKRVQFDFVQFRPFF